MMNQTKSILMWGKKDDDEDGDDDLFGGLVVWMVWMICLTKKMKVRQNPRNDQQPVQRLPRRNLPRRAPMRHI